MENEINPCLPSKQTLQDLVIKKFVNNVNLSDVKLQQLEPGCLQENLFSGKEGLAYGLWGLPKILSEIASKDTEVQYKALNKLVELLYKPSELSRSVEEYNIVKRLQRVLAMNMPQTPETQSCIGKILKCLQILTSRNESALQIVKDYSIMDTLFCIVTRNDSCIVEDCAKIFYLLSLHEIVADRLIYNGFLCRIRILLQDDCRTIHIYKCLCNLIRRFPEEAMYCGFYELFVHKLTVEDTLQALIVNCFALLLSTKEAAESFSKANGLHILFELLKRDSLAEYAALGLLNFTIKRNVICRCQEIWDLPIVLTQHAHSKTNCALQLFCLQVLRQITSLPSIKNFVRMNLAKSIKNIECRSTFVKEAKMKLLMFLDEKNYRAISLHPEEKLPKDKNKPDDETIDDLSTMNRKNHNPFSDEGNSCRKPRPIAYRLHYGKTCEVKPDLQTKEKPAFPRKYSTI